MLNFLHLPCWRLHMLHDHLLPFCENIIYCCIIYACGKPSRNINKLIECWLLFVYRQVENIPFNSGSEHEVMLNWNGWFIYLATYPLIVVGMIILRVTSNNDIFPTQGIRFNVPISVECGPGCASRIMKLTEKGIVT